MIEQNSKCGLRFLRDDGMIKWQILVAATNVCHPFIVPEKENRLPMVIQTIPLSDTEVKYD